MCVVRGREFSRLPLSIISLMIDTYIKVSLSDQQHIGPNLDYIAKVLILSAGGYISKFYQHVDRDENNVILRACTK